MSCLHSDLNVSNISLDEKSTVTIVDLIEHNSGLSRVELYNFKESYSLVMTESAGKKAITLDAISECRKTIESIYNSCKKHNVLQTLQKAKIWEKSLRQYIHETNKKTTRKNELINKNFKLSVYDFIEQKQKTVSFQDAYKEYKAVYMIADGDPGDLTQFKRFLDLKFLKIDEKDFLRHLYVVGSAKISKNNKLNSIKSV